MACTKCLNIPSPRTCQHSYDSLSNAYKKYGTELEYLVRESKNVMKNVSTLPATLEKALDNLQTSHDHVKSNVEETFHVILLYITYYNLIIYFVNFIKTFSRVLKLY